MDFIPDPSLQQKAQTTSGFIPDNGLSFDQSMTALGHSNELLTNKDKYNPFSVQGATTMTPSGALSMGGAIVGGIGGAALGAAIGAPTGPGAAITGYAGGVVGAGAGGAAGEALGQYIEKGSVNAGDVAKSGLLNAGLDAIGGPILSVGGKALEAAGKPIIQALGKGASKIGELFGGKGGIQVAEKVADKVTPPVARATRAVQSTAETMTKKERQAAIAEGRMSPTLTGGGKYNPSGTEKRAGEILSGKLSTNPVKNVPIIQNEIATQGKAAEKYLDQNSVKISNKEDSQAFQSIKDSSSKYMTPEESNAYGDQISVFQKILKEYSGDGGYNTANYYKALKDYESQVTANLPKGKDALLTPGGAGRIQAAKDVRSVVRDMIGSKHEEFKPKMFDLASLYDSLDNTIIKAERVGTFGKRHPYIAKGARYVGSGIGIGLGIEGEQSLTGR